MAFLKIRRSVSRELDKLPRVDHRSLRQIGPPDEDVNKTTVADHSGRPAFRSASSYLA
jgi:hypothetical protein